MHCYCAKRLACSYVYGHRHLPLASWRWCVENRWSDDIVGILLQQRHCSMENDGPQAACSRGHGQTASTLSTGEKLIDAQERCWENTGLSLSLSRCSPLLPTPLSGRLPALLSSTISPAFWPQMANKRPRGRGSLFWPPTPP